VGCDTVPFGGGWDHDLWSKCGAFVLKGKTFQVILKLLGHEDGGSTYRRNLKSHSSKDMTSHAIVLRMYSSHRGCMV
jgi:hypothetical protein